MQNTSVKLEATCMGETRSCFVNLESKLFNPAGEISAESWPWPHSGLSAFANKDLPGKFIRTANAMQLRESELGTVLRK